MKNLFAALAAFQGDVGPVFQDDSNPHFKSRFASTKQIMETIRPHLRKHGLAVVQFPKSGPDNSAGCRTIVLHESGESLEGDFFVPLGAKVDAQRAVSAVSYARRASLSGALGLVSASDMDTDGEDLVDRGKPALKPPSTPKAAMKVVKPARAAGPAMSKPSREKLKFCARERLKELKIEDAKDSDVLGIITAFAVTKNTTPKSLKEDVFGDALEWIQAWEPGA